MPSEIIPYTGFNRRGRSAWRPVEACGPFPLVVFSHGFGGCGIPSIFFTETLARQGYVVVRPIIGTALCSVDGSRPGSSTWGQGPPLWIRPRGIRTAMPIERTMS